MSFYKIYYEFDRVLTIVAILSPAWEISGIGSIRFNVAAAHESSTTSSLLRENNRRSRLTQRAHVSIVIEISRSGPGIVLYRHQFVVDCSS